ncbi:MAG: FHA domain-containing protein [Planctomycetia bacterium]|nr:FHA domain-containing protein [Planctomycetia bacterium]
MLGELQPIGGGDPIPLMKPVLTVGRRESCDIVLRFPNVSGSHCELSLENGYWFVKDLGSSNGTKVNGVRVKRQRLDPGDKLAVARHKYEVCYEPSKLGATALPADKAAQQDVFSRSLLATAGLESRRVTFPPQAADGGTDADGKEKRRNPAGDAGEPARPRHRPQNDGE